MDRDYLVLIGPIFWGIFMLVLARFAEHQYKLAIAEEDEEFYRQIYGPAGKPKKPVIAEPESPTRSAE